MSDFKAKMHQIRFRLGLRPRPRWGSLQRSTKCYLWTSIDARDEHFYEQWTLSWVCSVESVSCSGVRQWKMVVVSATLSHQYKTLGRQQVNQYHPQTHTVTRLSAMEWGSTVNASAGLAGGLFSYKPYPTKIVLPLHAGRSKIDLNGVTGSVIKLG